MLEYCQKMMSVSFNLEYPDLACSPQNLESDCSFHCCIIPLIIMIIGYNKKSVCLASQLRQSIGKSHKQSSDLIPASYIFDGAWVAKWSR